MAYMEGIKLTDVEIIVTHKAITAQADNSKLYFVLHALTLNRSALFLS